MGIFWEQGFDSLPHNTGFRDRPEINFKTAVAVGPILSRKKDEK